MQHISKQHPAADFSQKIVSLRVVLNCMKERRLHVQHTPSEEAQLFKNCQG